MNQPVRRHVLWPVYAFSALQAVYLPKGLMRASARGLLCENHLGQGRGTIRGL